jgi:hypothetical protein
MQLMRLADAALNILPSCMKLIRFLLFPTIYVTMYTRYLVQTS